MREEIKVGQLIADGENRRDAIHIAVAPVRAAHGMEPGTRVGLNRDGSADETCPPIGIVDPFLTHRVSVGDKFWLFLFPGTITGLRHVWTHPAFANKSVYARNDKEIVCASLAK